MRRFIVFLIGISFWIAFSSSNALLDVFPHAAFQVAAIDIAYLGAFCLSFPLAAFIQRRFASQHRYLLPVIALAALLAFLTLGLIKAYLAPFDALAYIAVTALGLSCATGYCQWVCLLSKFTTFEAKALLALGSFVAIATMFLFALPGDAILISNLICFGFCPIAYVFLFLNTAQQDRGLSTEGLHQGITGAGASSAPPWPPRSNLRSLLPSVACAMSLVLVAPISSVTFALWVGPIPAQSYIAPIAHLCGLALLSLIWFVFKRELSFVQVYGVTLPITVSLVVFSSLFSPSFLWFALFVGDLCFFLVSILMVSTSVTTAHAHHCSAVSIYALFAGCVYSSDVLQHVLNRLTQSGALDGMQYMTILLLLYILMVPAFYLVSRAAMGKKQRDPSPIVSIEKEAPTGDRIDFACDLIANEKQLSPRQRELLGYFARGRDAAYIANALVLSPHTVKSYRKTLYVSLNVHNQQQLIDMVEEAIKGEEPTSVMPSSQGK